MFEKYSQHVQKHPKTIIALWVVVLLVALPFALQAEDVLNYDMTTMGGLDSESKDGQELVNQYFDASLSTDTVLVIPYENSTQLTSIKTKLVDSDVLEKAMEDEFGKNKVTLSIMGSFGESDAENGVYLITIQYADGISATDSVGDARDAVSNALETADLDIDTYVTGTAAITYDTLQGANADVQRIDPLSILLILVLLGLFFWTLVTALVPPLVVGTAYGIVLALMYGLGQVFDIFYITKTIVLVSMLGAGCDYSVFIIARYREERLYGNKDKSAALTEAIKWAGESVFTSGLAVIIGFAVMSLCTFSLVSSMAIILALGIVMAMLAALSLIPAVIALVGDKVFWPRKIEDYSGESKMRGGVYGRMVGASRRYFGWAGKFSTKHAVPIVVVAILLTIPLGYVALTSEDSFDMISVMPDSEGKDGVHQITDNTDGGYMMPTYALIEFDQPIAKVTMLQNGVGTLTWTDYGQKYVASIQSNLVGASLMGGEAGALQKADDNISTVLGPTPWAFLYETVKETVKEIVKKTASPQVEEKLYNYAYQYAMSQGGASEEVAKNFAKAYVEEHLEETLEATVTPEMVNKAIISEAGLPEMVTLPLSEFFETYQAWNKAPTDYLADTMPVTIASLIDYQVNVGAGLVSYSAEHTDTTGKYAQIMIIVKDEPMSQTSMDSIGTARGVMSDFAGSNSWVLGTWVLGTGAVLYDISDVVNTQFHWIEIGVIVLIYILLLFVLGVYFTPIRSLATIMMSVVWTLGALHLVFSTAMGVDVIWIVPIVLFVICLGLGMDYDILLTTRIREGKLKGLSNDEAIQNALSWSGSIITLCGLIMGGTFLTMLSSGSSMLQEIGFALGFAILVDALFVVPYVVPALMHLMGDWSWKGPKFLEGRRTPEVSKDEKAE